MMLSNMPSTVSFAALNLPDMESLISLTLLAIAPLMLFQVLEAAFLRLFQVLLSVCVIEFHAPEMVFQVLVHQLAIACEMA